MNRMMCALIHDKQYHMLMKNYVYICICVYIGIGDKP